MRETTTPEQPGPVVEGTPPAKLENGQRWQFIDHVPETISGLTAGGRWTCCDGVVWSRDKMALGGWTYLGPATAAPVVPPEPRAPREGDRWRDTRGYEDGTRWDTGKPFTLTHRDSRGGGWNFGEGTSYWPDVCFTDGRLAFVDHGEPRGAVMEGGPAWYGIPRPAGCLQCGAPLAPDRVVTDKNYVYLCDPCGDASSGKLQGLWYSWTAGARDFPRGPRPQAASPAPPAPNGQGAETEPPKPSLMDHAWGTPDYKATPGYARFTCGDCGASELAALNRGQPNVLYGCAGPAPAPEAPAPTFRVRPKQTYRGWTGRDWSAARRVVKSVALDGGYVTFLDGGQAMPDRFFPTVDAASGARPLGWYFVLTDAAPVAPPSPEAPKVKAPPESEWVVVPPSEPVFAPARGQRDVESLRFLAGGVFGRLPRCERGCICPACVARMRRRYPSVDDADCLEDA